MPSFRLLYFRSNRLERHETIEAADEIAAVQQASSRSTDEILELWSDRGRIALIRPTRRDTFR